MPETAAIGHNPAFFGEDVLQHTFFIHKTATVIGVGVVTLVNPLLLAELTAGGIVNVMQDVPRDLPYFQALWQVKVVVLDIIDLFVQVFYHVSVGVVKVLNTFERTVVGKEKEVHIVTYQIANIGKGLFDFLVEGAWDWLVIKRRLHVFVFLILRLDINSW